MYLEDDVVIKARILVVWRKPVGSLPSALIWVVVQPLL